MISLLVLAGLSFGAAGGAKEPDYLRDVKPILAARCYACHAAIKQKGELRVDTASFIREGGASGPAVFPGKDAESLLVKRVLGQGGLKRMPPADAGEALKPAQVALIRRWIERGAIGPTDEKPETDPRDHWAFKAPIRPAVPRVNGPWVRNPVDAFLLERQERVGLTPQPPATKAVLLRRVYLDLVGLPPTRAELNAFLADPAPDAYEKTVDRLLASPQYGERWGRHWMDVWRYSDWWGLGAELRNSQRHMWHWRDWIVESLNRDKGYDRMVREMIAADELYPTDADALRGTGFLARHYFKFNRTTWLDETIEHTAKAFLGLTFNCAKCHDHKYDPVSQLDYYRFRAIFEPYQVRLDQVPGEADYEKDGVPRVFDCNLDTPTYLHVRGNEQSPDKARTIKPGLPKLLAPAGLPLTAIDLPAEAYQPGLRAFVLQNHLDAAAKELAAARADLEKARNAANLAGATQAKKPIAAKSKTLLHEDFAGLDKERWETIAGAWEIAAGKLVQKRDGDMRGALRLKQPLPADFEASFRFAILGGKQWRSVGITFDVDGTHEALVYLTAHAGDQRVQFAYKQGGSHVYPPDARAARTVQLNATQELTIRVRGPLLNVAVNGTHAFAYQMPLGRRPGSLELITFDASARFDGFSLAALSTSTALVPAGNAAAHPVSVAQAHLLITAAEKRMAAAESLAVALKARSAADVAAARPAGAPVAKELARQAALAEKRHAVAQAEAALAVAQGKGVAQPIQQAKAALDVARKALAVPGEKYTRLVGALKTLESNLETEASRRKPFPRTSTGRRAALAAWIADRKNPLTARVAVNHLWTRHFGQPLAPTVFDLGRKGTPPTHPELLDWLAVELMDNDWSMKRLHKLMVTSNAYRMTSSLAGAAAANRKLDPDNRLLWHMNPSRMEAEVVRDSLLHLAGALDPAIGGPSVEMAKQDGSRRRSLYFFHSAIERNRFLTTFDEADALECYRRRESIVPQQALALSNSKLALEMADQIAGRLDRDLGEAADPVFARAAFMLLLATVPAEGEQTACVEALERWRTLYQGLPPAEARRRARSHLVHALLNHNDFVTVR